jgi:endonuclease/exonuclease/phosphatase family metal-dependent hydrolase
MGKNMAFSVRRLGKRFFILCNLAVSLMFLVACLQPWLNPETFWWVSFMSLSFPIGLLGVLAFLVFWLVLKKWGLALISLATLGLGWQQIGVLFSAKKPAFTLQKPAQQLRVLSWNVRSFAGLKPDKAAKASNADSMFALIAGYAPDVVCFQEFGQYGTPGLGVDYKGRMTALGYKHSVLSNDYSRAVYNYTNGLAIFSKLPFAATKRIPFTSNPESLLYADVVQTDSSVVRVYTTHLQSFKFNGSDYADIERIKSTDDKMVEAGKNIFSKMKRAFRNRGQQADMIRPLLDDSPYPEILACDLNDVPTSYAYWKLRGSRKDAFLEKGFGIGRTFLALSPTLRIDYLMADERFVVQQFRVINKRFSDHLPLVMDVAL